MRGFPTTRKHWFGLELFVSRAPSRSWLLLASVPSAYFEAVVLGCLLSLSTRSHETVCCALTPKAIRNRLHAAQVIFQPNPFNLLFGCSFPMPSSSNVVFLSSFPKQVPSAWLLRRTLPNQFPQFGWALTAHLQLFPINFPFVAGRPLGRAGRFEIVLGVGGA